MHTLEAHGGIKPLFLATIGNIEQHPLYRMVCESVRIAGLPLGIGNMNWCQEWGNPHVPVFSTRDNALDQGYVTTTVVSPENPNPDWTREMLTLIKDGGVKTIKLTRRRMPQPRGVLNWLTLTLALQLFNLILVLDLSMRMRIHPQPRS